MRGEEQQAESEIADGASFDAQGLELMQRKIFLQMESPKRGLSTEQQSSARLCTATTTEGAEPVTGLN